MTNDTHRAKRLPHNDPLIRVGKYSPTHAFLLSQALVLLFLGSPFFLYRLLSTLDVDNNSALFSIILTGSMWCLPAAPIGAAIMARAIRRGHAADGYRLSGSGVFAGAAMTVSTAFLVCLSAALTQIGLIPSSWNILSDLRLALSTSTLFLALGLPSSILIGAAYGVLFREMLRAYALVEEMTFRKSRRLS